jgi:hypothetical protein
MPFGAFFGGAFFFMLFLAAITSSISMLQPGIAFLEEALNVGRRLSVALLGLITTFGTGLVVYFTKELKALDTLDFWIGTLLIFVLATIQILVFGWHWGIGRGFKEMHTGASMRVPRVFGPVMRWISPVFMLAIFALWVLKEIFGFDLATMRAGAPSSYVTDLFGEKPSLPAQLSMAMAVALFVFLALITARAKAFKHAERGLDKTGN